MILLAREKQTHRYKKQICGYQGGRRGKNWEMGVDTYTLLILCITEITNENLLYSTANYLMHCGHLKGKEVQKGGDVSTCIHFAVQQKLIQGCKATTLQ